MLSPCGGDSDARRYGMQASTLSPDSRGNITISRYVDTVVKRWQRYAGDQALGTSTFLLPGIRVRSSFVQVSVPPHGKEAKPMHGKKQFRNSLFQVISRAAAAVLAIVVLFSKATIWPNSATVAPHRSTSSSKPSAALTWIVQTTSATPTTTAFPSLS